MDPLFLLDEEVSAPLQSHEPDEPRAPPRTACEEDGPDFGGDPSRAHEASAHALASSVPITIPSQFKRKHAAPAGDAAAAAREPPAFVPPHQLSHRDPTLLLDSSSIPLSSSSKLRNRNAVLRSTGFLPANSTEGFLVSRADAGSHAGVSGRIGAAPAASERSQSARAGRQLTAAILEPLQRMLSEQSVGGGAPSSVQPSIPERGAEPSPPPVSAPVAQ